MQAHQIHTIGAPHGGLSQVWWWLTLTYFPRSQTQKTAKWCTHNNLPQLWCRLTKFKFDDEWHLPCWPTLYDHRPKSLSPYSQYLANWSYVEYNIPAVCALLHFPSTFFVRRGTLRLFGQHIIWLSYPHYFHSLQPPNGETSVFVCKNIRCPF